MKLREKLRNIKTERDNAARAAKISRLKLLDQIRIADAAIVDGTEHDESVLESYYGNLADGAAALTRDCENCKPCTVHTPIRQTGIPVPPLLRAR